LLDIQILDATPQIAGLETPRGRAGAADLLKLGSALPAESFARIFPDIGLEDILNKGFRELESCFLIPE